MQATVQPIW